MNWGSLKTAATFKASDYIFYLCDIVGTPECSGYGQKKII